MATIIEIAVVLFLIYVKSYCQVPDNNIYNGNSRKQSIGAGITDASKYVNHPNQLKHSSNKKLLLAKQPACSVDIRNYCSGASSSNNMAVLDCLQHDTIAEKDISSACQHLIWTYKYNLTRDIRFDAAAHSVCQDNLKMISECASLPKGEGKVIPCLIEHKKYTTHKCKQFLTKMASIIFSDFRLIGDFASKCMDDVKKTSCGRINSAAEDFSQPHSQGHTIECLSKHLDIIDEKCKLQILRIAELQSDDFHMDRPLYFACREDRERFCSRVKSGDGKVFKCLSRHKSEKDMSSACKEKIINREKLLVEDYKVSKSFTINCRKDIKKNHCLKKIPDSRQERLSTIIICLESAVKDGNKIEPECWGEVKDVRKQIMSDYEMDPELIIDCKIEIKESCDSGTHKNGKTIHCLLNLAKNSRMEGEKISPKCVQALKNLLEEADVGENYSVDQALQEACQPVVDTICKNIPEGQGAIMGCLMAHMTSDKMTVDCREKLLELQYFVTRNFKLDHQLYRICKRNARDYCHSPSGWSNPDEVGPDNGPLIFSCLYGIFKSPTGSQKQLTRACTFEINRILRERLLSAELDPALEEKCLRDLSSLCSLDTSKGMELKCLQDNYDVISEKNCKELIGNYTQDMDKDITLDRVLMESCTPVIKEMCTDVIKNDNSNLDDLMDCLIKNKRSKSMNTKCVAGIEHHQLINLKNYKFSYKFKKACRLDVSKNCKNVKTMAETLECLSESIRNDTLLDTQHRVSQDCQKEIRMLLLEKTESVVLNPKIHKLCKDDIEQFCSNLTPGSGQVLKCLEMHQSKLSIQCREKVFKLEVQVANDPKGDYVLMRSCKDMIKWHCDQEEAAKVIECLSRHKDDMDFDVKCKRIIVQKEVISNKDIRLNPVLMKACHLDIPKLCKHLEKEGYGKIDMEGKVIGCLRVKFFQNLLSSECKDHIRSLVKESASDVRQDPRIVKECANEIKLFCLKDTNADIYAEDHGGRVLECLKMQLTNKKIQNPNCAQEIATVVMESKVDIHVDVPLYKACALDLKHYCANIPQGQGRLMSCMIASLEDKSVHLQRTCEKMLRERVDMWEFAAKVAPPETINELLLQVTSSSSKNYFFIMTFSLLGTLFFIGIMCGRITKSIKTETKNK